MGWPTLLALWGLPNLQTVDRDVHMEDAPPRQRPRGASARTGRGGCKLRRGFRPAQADELQSARSRPQPPARSRTRWPSTPARRSRSSAAPTLPATHSTLSAMIACTAGREIVSRVPTNATSAT